MESLEDLLLKEGNLDRVLKPIGWVPLVADRILGPWDMLWVRNNGRVEIEIVKEGVVVLRNASTTVKDPDGRWTRKHRLAANSFFIMAPEYFIQARINKIIGDVLVATDADKVKEFYENYASPLWLGAPTLQGSEWYARWLEMLKKPELE